MRKSNENTWELIMVLAKTDFKLRYYGSFLGYLWAIIKPLFLFAILNTVFTSIFNFRDIGIPYYPLQLLTGILLFNFFSEGTISGMVSLLSKNQLVTKTYIPRWTIIIAATLNSFLVFLVNLGVLTIFFIFYAKIPTLTGVIMFLFLGICLYMIIVAFSLLTSGIFARFRDISMIWEVLLPALMYSAPVVYPLSLIPINLQRLVLINPVGFIIHFSKQALIFNEFPPLWQIAVLFGAIMVLLAGSWYVFTKLERTVAEYL